MDAQSTQRLPLTSDASLPLEQLTEGSPAGLVDVSGLATRHGNTVDVLLFHYADEDLPAPAAAISLAVSGLPSKPIHVTQYLMDHDHANAFTMWQQLGSPRGADRRAG